MALAPDDAALPGVRAIAEKRFSAPGFGLAEGGTVGTPDLVIDRLRELRAMGFGQVVLFTHDRASDQALNLLADKVIGAL